MTKTPIPLVTPDISAFSRALGKSLRDTVEPPGHLSLMNMLARAAGFQNFQHLRAAHAASQRLAAPAPTPEPVDHRLVERTIRRFDNRGRMVSWPSRRAMQDLALWSFWALLPAGRVMQESEINDILLTGHLFEDPAILRRSLITLGLATRNVDGSDYRRVERPPPATARALIGHVSARRRALP